MRTASSRRHRRLRPVRQLRTIRLEPLERRALLSASLGWAKVFGSGQPATSDGLGDTFVTDATRLSKFMPDGTPAWDVPAPGFVAAADLGSVYTTTPAKFATADGSLLWSRPGLPNVSDVAPGPDGSVYVVGYVIGTADVDPGPGVFNIIAPSGPNAYVAKLDPQGNFAWAQVVGSTGGSNGAVDITTPFAIGTDAAGNVIVAITFANSFRPPFYPGGVHLTKLDSTGSLVWTHTVGTTGTKARDLAVAPAGEFVIAGSAGLTDDFDPGAGTATLAAEPYSGATPSSAYVARYDASGAFSWMHAVRTNAANAVGFGVEDVDISSHGAVAVATPVVDLANNYWLVRRFDSAGNVTTDLVYDVARSVSFGNGGRDLVVSGTFRQTFDADPGPGVFNLVSPTPGTPAGFLLRLTDPSQYASLTGTAIGTPGSWNNSGNDFTKAFDGNPDTFFDAPTPQAWVGYDFGRPLTLSSVSYTPRAGYEGRMVGGSIEGSADGTNWTALATITAAPPAGVLTTLPVDATTSYRYLRYLSPDGGFGNVAELKFFGPAADVTPPVAPAFATASWDGTRVSIYWTDLATNETGYEGQLFDNPTFTGTPVATATRPANFFQLYFDNFNVPGTYYGRVRAVNSYGPSGYVDAGQVTIAGIPAAPSSASGYAVTPDTLRYGWADNALNETGYEYQLATDAAFAAIVRTGTTGANASSVDIGGLSPGRYYFRVRAVNGLGASDYALAAPADVPVLPTAPADFRVTAALPHELFVAWTAVPGGATAYRLQVASDAAFTSIAGTLDIPGDATTASLAGLPAGTYYARLQAIKGTFGGAYSVLGPVTLPTTVRLTGTPIGTPGSWQNAGNTLDKALDGNLNTFFDAPTPDGNVVGYDFGRPVEFMAIGYAPRSGFADRMVGGRIETSLDGVNWDYLWTVDSAPPDGQLTTIEYPLPHTVRYVRYLSPAGGFGNIAELQVYGLPTAASTPEIPSNVAYSASFRGLTFSWHDNATNETGYRAELSTSPDFAPASTSVVTMEANSSNITFGNITPGTSFLPAGTYYFRLTATAPAGNSPWYTTGPIQFAAPSASVVMGTAIGSPGSWNNSGNTFDKALDGNLNTYFDAPTPDDNVVGYDFGNSGVALSFVRYAPRPGFAGRMVGGAIEGSNDGANWIVLGRIAVPPAAGALSILTINNPIPYRYLRYHSPPDSFGNVAELQFVGTLSPTIAAPNVTPPPGLVIGTPIGSPGSWNNSGNVFNKAIDGNLASFFDAPTPDGNFVGYDFAGAPVAISSVRFAPRAGFSTRMIGGEIQASDDGTSWSTLARIDHAPPEGIFSALTINAALPHRFVRYWSPPDSFGNVAELQFFNAP